MGDAEAQPKEIIRSLRELLGDGLESDATERLLPELQALIARSGLRTRANYADEHKIDTNAKPATAAGVVISAHEHTRGWPMDSIGVKSVGGAGTSMTISINNGPAMEVEDDDKWDNMEIWVARVRVETPGAGTAKIRTTAYIPGIKE